MPQWKDVEPSFRGSAMTMGDAHQAVASGAGLLNKFAGDIEAQKRYEAEKAQKDLLFQQAQEDRAQSLKDRENRILLSGLSSELLPHLQAQDTRPAEFDGVLNNAQQIPSGSTGTSVKGSGMSISVPYSYDKRVKLEAPNPEINYNVNVGGKVVPTTNKPYNITSKSDILNIPGMYNTTPASSVRTLNKQGEALLKTLEDVNKQKDAITAYGSKYMVDSSWNQGRHPTEEGKRLLAGLDSKLSAMVPGNATGAKVEGGKLESRKTTFNDLDLSTVLDVKGKPATEKTDDKYYRDTKSDNLVPLTKAMSASETIGKAPTEKIETVVGTKRVGGHTLSRVMADAKQYGMNPEDVKQSYGRIDDGYKEVLGMLPKDNSARRDELRGYLTQIASNLGMDPKDYDINKQVDSILPKSEMSESQKFAANTVIHALDEKKKEIMDNKQLALKEKEMLLNQEYRNASLALQQSEFAWKKATTKAERNPVQEKIDLEMAMRELDARYPKKLNPKEAFEFAQAKKKAEREDETYRKQHDLIPFND